LFAKNHSLGAKNGKRFGTKLNTVVIDAGMKDLNKK
jgi:hypothetical protein